MTTLLTSGDYNDKGRWIPAVPPLEPFYCFAMGGAAVRNGHKIKKAGFYYVDAANKLYGPFVQRRLAARAIGERQA